ncbi:glycosyltransferase [Aphanothece hegewaldii CCALA 016]|uniref:Glycosyltransferase n=1 Tax=Aphanothece hegewaldii CCALA 016 TaxID=2107694 RepID=A0A2T1M3V1_9CHRO|nr:WecB/TagA/CpsF family glycosyltransferase [Aphanothece hegewaldii]PSF39430.1 glycosyltransferase [Aphanothece hegewaldii CCALA 016]
MKVVKILNASIDNLTKQELLAKLTQYGGFLITPNVDHLVKLQTDAEFLEVYHQATYRVCDSKILQYASRFLGNPIKEKISGSDFFPAFYKYNKYNENIKIFLLGAKEGISQKAQHKINRKVGREMVVDTYSPPLNFEYDEAECQKIIQQINQSGATVLAAGLGSPKQEKWILKYRHQLKNIKIFLAIGATIDFEAGYKPRAPKWMSEIGLEWLYRLVSEPKRLWRRYLVDDMYFFWLIVQQKLHIYETPRAVKTLSLGTSRN